jgi:hypothetical protein
MLLKKNNVLLNNFFLEKYAVQELNDIDVFSTFKNVLIKVVFFLGRKKCFEVIEMFLAFSDCRNNRKMKLSLNPELEENKHLRRQKTADYIKRKEMRLLQFFGFSTSFC